MARQSPQARRDLAAMLVPLGRALTRAELPVLAEHGLTMWAYVVLTALRDGGAGSQASLADAIGADRTRIIGVLDDLQNRRLIVRSPDPSDRRSNVLSLTPAGRRLCDSAQSQVQNRENRILGQLADGDRSAFLRALARLSSPDGPVLGQDG